MAIRTKNIDFGTDGMKRCEQTFQGDITADLTRTVFVTPVDCVVDFVDLYSLEACPPAGTTASTTGGSATVRAIINGTNSVMTARGNSATAITSDSISANARYRFIPSANNSLTVGTPVQIVWDQNGSGTLSGVMVHVTYTPLEHRNTR